MLYIVGSLFVYKLELFLIIVSMTIKIFRFSNGVFLIIPLLLFTNLCFSCNLEIFLIQVSLTIKIFRFSNGSFKFYLLLTFNNCHC